MSAGSSSQIKPDILAKNIELGLPGFKISGQDLKTPTKNLVVSYFTTVMEEFEMDFGPYHLHDIAHAVNLYHVVAYVFSHLSIGFNFDDIVNPVPKRTLQLFAVMDNFHSFADLQVCELSKLHEKWVSKMAALQQLTKAKNELLEKENQQAVQRDTWLEQAQQLQEHVEELNMAEAAVMEKQHRLCESLKIIAQKLVSGKKDVEKLTAAVKKMDGDVSQLDKKIVTKSPEELQHEVAALEAVVSSLNDDLESQNSCLQQRAERIRLLGAELTGQQDSNSNFEQAWSLQCKEKEMTATLLGIQQETEAVEVASKQMHQQLCVEKKERAKLQKVYNKTKQDLDKKLSTFDDDLQKLKREFADLWKSQEEKDVELATLHEKTLAIVSEQEEEAAAINLEHKAYEDACERYNLQVKTYSEGILKDLKRFK